MKIVSVLLFLFVFLQQDAKAQPDAEVNSLVGLWKGHIKSTERRLPYELVISYKEGKFSGYSYTTFGVKDDVATMKKINISFENGQIIISDEDVLYNNIKKDAAKAIKQINTLVMNDNKLTGSFETKVPEGFKTARGSVSLEKQETKEESKAMAKLDEMDLSKDLSFNLDKPALNTRVNTDLNTVKTAAPSADTSIVSGVDPLLVKENQDIIAKAVPQVEKPAPKIDSVVIVKAEAPKKPVETKPAPVIAKAEPAKAKPAAVKEKPVTATAAKPKPSVAKPAPVIAKTDPAKPKPGPPVATAAEAGPKPRAVPANITVGPLVDLSKRKIETIDELVIEADSLRLTLYDNGEVDGDTVSIVLNGKTIVSRQGLTANAFSKIIYITPDMGDSVQLVMYAENLGALPPNSGLLVVDYDKRRKEIRFSGDLSKNAAITLKRKKGL
ncbi:MAG: hypothetical protein WAT19_07480 [Ferruginibacter sp.]